MPDGAMTLAGKIIVGCYGALPRSEAVSYLLDDGLPNVSPRDRPLPPVGGPGTAPVPLEPSKPTLMTRYVRHIRRTWATGLPFPNPLQSMILAGGIGLLLLFGDPLRTSAPVYDAIRQYGGVTLWGLGYLGVTVALTMCWRWFHRGLFLAYVLAASGYLLIAVALAAPAWRLESVSWLAGFTFLWLSWVHAQAARRVSREWRIEVWLRHKLRRRE